MPDLDHRIMVAPFLRIVDQRQTPSGDPVAVWDFRVAQPNKEPEEMAVLHTLEHFLGVHLKATSASVIDVALMGCQTGFHITATITVFREMAAMLAAALHAVTTAREVPLANEIDCGRAANHSLMGAQALAETLLAARSDWLRATIAEYASIDDADSRSERPPGKAVDGLIGRDDVW